MGNDWTRLLQEAALKGGPVALKAGLKQAGRLQGLVIGGGVVGAAWVGTEIKSATDRIQERRREKAAAAAAGNSSVVVVEDEDTPDGPEAGTPETPRG